MNPRTTGILFLVAAALGAFVYFYVIRGEEGRKEAEARAKRLFPDVEAEDITWVELTSSDGKQVRAERRDKGWEIVKPIDFPGDTFALDGVASALAQVQSEAVYEKPQPASVYGLDDPAREVRFGDGGGEHALRTGDKTPMGGNSYAAVVGETPVYTVPTYRVTALQKSLDDLRDKRILSFDAESVRKMTVSWPGGRVELERGDQGWRLTAPLDARADQSAVSDLLSDLSFLRASGFDDAPGSDAETGLASPAFSVDLELAPAEEGAEPRHLSLAVGSKVEGEQRLVRAGRPTLFRIAASRIDDFPRDVSAYRFRQLASFAPLDARRVEMDLRHGDERLDVVATRGDAGWQASPEPMDPDKIAGMIDALSRLEATEVLAEHVGPDERAGLGLDPPRATITVYGEAPSEGEGGEEAEKGGGEEAKTSGGEEAGKSGGASSGGETRLAQILIGTSHGSDGFVAQSGEEPELFLLGVADSEHLPVSLEAFRNRFRAKAKKPPEAAAGAGEDADEARFLDQLREQAQPQETSPD